MWFTNPLTHFYGRHIHVGVMFSLLLFILPLNILLAQSAHASQTIPYKLNFQGRLTDSNGNIKPDGTYNMKLRLWTAASGGSNVWSEIRGDNGTTNANRVQVTNGLFSIQLGDITALSTTIFSNGTYPLYLEVELPTPATATCTGVSCTSYTEGAMTPRSTLGSSGYAFNADTVDGIDGSSLARVDATNTFTASNTYNSGTTNTFNGNLLVNNTETVTNNSLIGLNIAGTTGAYTLQASGTGGYFYTDGTNVHIGMTASGSAGASTSPTTTSNDSEVIANDSNYSGSINAGLNWGDNLVPNPGFEYGCLDWTNCTVETTNVNSGKNASKITTTVGTPVKSTLNGGAIGVRPGDMYYFAGYIKASASNIGTLKVGLDQYDKNNAFISTLSINAANSTSYTQFETTMTLASNATYVKPNITTNGDGAGSGNWYVDDLLLQHQDNQTQPVFKSPVDATTAFQIQNAGGTALFVVDATNKAIKIGGGDVSPDASPTLLVLDYKNTSGDPTGTNGGMYYNSTTNKMRCYENSAWRDCIQSAMTRYDQAEDFMNYSNGPTNGTFPDSAFTIGASGGYTLAYSNGVTNHPGILNMSLSYNFSTTIAGVSTSYTNSPSTNPLVFGAGAWTFIGITRLNVISNATNRYVYYLGFADGSQTASPSNGCYLQYTDNVNSGKWQGICKKAGTSSTCDTGLAAATATWYNMSVAVNAAGTSATFIINGSNTCTVSTNVPTAATSASAMMNETAGAANVDLDYVEFYGDPLSR